MKVYIDVLFIFNFLFDFIILNGVNFILKRNVSNTRMILGSLVGESSLLLLFISSFYLIIKFLISLFVVFVSFGYKDINYFSKNVMYFYLVSSLMGGSVYFLRNQLSISYFFILVLSIVLFRYFILSFNRLRNNYSNYYRVRVYFDDNNYVNLNGFLDTGNKLLDPYSRKGIILVNYDKIKDFSLNNEVYVPYHSLNNRGLLKCYKGVRIEIDGKEMSNFLVGVSNEEFYMDGIDCILNLKIMEGLR